MGYYPVFLELAGIPVLLVGGGHVALEKIGRLVEAGARVTIVAPDIIPPVRAYIDDRRVEWRPRAFAAGDTIGHRYVFVATDNGVVNREVADEARASGLPVNAADDVANCDFILPAVVQRGPIQIAASTGGTSPAMARWLREHLEAFLSDDVVTLAEVLAAARGAVRAGDRECASRCTATLTPPPLLCTTCPNRIPPDRWQEAITDEVMRLIAAGDRDQACTRILDGLGRTTLTPSATWREVP